MKKEINQWNDVIHQNEQKFFFGVIQIGSIRFKADEAIFLNGMQILKHKPQNTKSKTSILHQ